MFSLAVYKFNKNLEGLLWSVLALNVSKKHQAICSITTSKVTLFKIFTDVKKLITNTLTQSIFSNLTQKIQAQFFQTPIVWEIT